jgi:hypothetical protein
MPALENTRHEAFAQAVTRGSRADQAYEDAGFAPGNDHGARLRAQPEVAERIAELRAGQAHLAHACLLADRTPASAPAWPPQA